MKKLTTLILFMYILSFSSTAQIETFDLAKFKLPNFKRQSLSFIFGANNQNNFDSWKDTSEYFF